MAIAFVQNLVTNRDSVDRSSYTFTSGATPNSANVVVAFVSARKASGMTDPSTVTVCGISLTKQSALSNTADQMNTSMWSGNGAWSGTTVTIAFGSTFVNCDVSIGEFSGVDTSTHFAQVGTPTQNSTGTTGTLTLGAAPTSGAVVAGVAHQANEATTVGSGFTTFSGTGTAGASPNTALLGEYQLANDQTLDGTWTTTTNWIVVGGELNLPAAAATVKTLAAMGVG